jgi:hypothetical protein
MAQRYTGKDYVIANIQTERVMLKITPDRVLNNLRRLA